MPIFFRRHTSNVFIKYVESLNLKANLEQNEFPANF